MKQYTLLGFAVMVGSLLVAGPVAAQTYDPEFEEPGMDTDQIGAQDDSLDQPTYAQPVEDPSVEPVSIDDPYMQPVPQVSSRQNRLLTPFGMGLTVGGGANGFTDSDFAKNVKVGGGWEARATFGTRMPVAVEAAYIGTANRLDTEGVSDNAVLLSNGVEADIRVNLSDTRVKPYVLAGAGWKRYSIQNTDTNNSSLNDSDNILEVPLGVGLSYSYNGFIADVRGTWRPAFDNDLTSSELGSGGEELHTWKAGANIGFEF